MLNCRGHFCLHYVYYDLKTENTSRVRDVFWAPWQNTNFKERKNYIYFFPQSSEVLAFYLSLGFTIGSIIKCSSPSKSSEAFNFFLQTISSNLTPRTGCYTCSNLNFTWDSFTLTCPHSNPCCRDTPTLPWIYIIQLSLFLIYQQLPISKVQSCAFWH